jgi:hypothetical protein
LKEKHLNTSDYLYPNHEIEIQAFIMSFYKNIVDYKLVSTPISARYDDEALIVDVTDDHIRINAPNLNALLKKRAVEVGPPQHRYNEEVTPFFVSGAFTVPDIRPVKYAGGVRVKEIKLFAFSDNQKITRFEYTKPNSTTSSGVTTFTPFSYPSVIYPTHNEDYNDFADYLNSAGREGLERARVVTQKLLSTSFRDYLKYASEAPAPGALYEYVTVKNFNNGVEGENYTVHHHQAFTPDMVSYSKVNDNMSDQDSENVDNIKSTVTIVNHSVNVGNNLSTTVYAKNGEMLNQTTYGYLYDNHDEPFEQVLKNQKQGVIDQTFHKYITIKEYDVDRHSSSIDVDLEKTYNKAVVTKKVDYSNVLTTVTSKDFRLGLSDITEYRKFDFYTGKVVETVVVDKNGNRFLSKTVPAYTASINGSVAYPAMGLKLFNSGNRHMLTQEAASYEYRVDNEGTLLGLSGASAQTWSNSTTVLKPGANSTDNTHKQASVWRPLANYQFGGTASTGLGADGFYPVNSFQEFSAWTSSSTPSGWLKTGEIQLYGVNSGALQAIDLNGNASATILSKNQLQVVASAPFAEYDEVFILSEEDPGFENQSGVMTTEKAHTGVASYELPSQLNDKMPRRKISARTKSVILSAWANSSDINSLKANYKFFKNGIEVSSGPLALHPDDNRKAGIWNLIEASVTVPQRLPNDLVELEISLANEGQSTAWIDDLRIHPFNSHLQTYVYDKWGQVSFILNSNNMFTRYCYDEMGRLTRIKQERFKLGSVTLSETAYHFGTSN